MKLTFKKAWCLSWVYLKYLMISCFLISQIFSTIPGYHYNIRGKRGANAISIGNTVLGTTFHSSKSQKEAGRLLFQCNGSRTKMNIEGCTQSYVCSGVPFPVFFGKRASCPAPFLGLMNMTAAYSNPAYSSIVKKEDYKGNMEIQSSLHICVKQASRWYGL